MEAKEKPDAMALEDYLPAFPGYNHAGMRLRDWFAGHALATMAIDTDSVNDMAHAAYQMADAMMKAREEEPTNG